MTVDFTIQTGEPEETKAIPAGACCAGRTETEKAPAAMQEKKKFPRRRTVKGRKRRRAKNPCGKTTSGKNAGQHIRPGIVEAAEILIAELYLVGKIIDPHSPFDLIGYRNGDIIRLRVVRPKQNVANATQAKALYEKEIREIQPYWKSDADNIQFWIFSRENGLLRYQIIRSVIWNVETMPKTLQKKQETKPVSETAEINDEIRRMRNAPCPATPTGTAAAPVDDRFLRL
jgi:hypothetical protein